MRFGALLPVLLGFVFACNSSPETSNDAAGDAGVNDAFGGADAGFDSADVAADSADATRPDSGADAPDGADAAADAGADTGADVASDAADADADADASPDVVDTDADVAEDADVAPDVAPPPGVLINEIGCQGPDFIELYNPTGRAIALDGFVLTDDPSDPERGYVFGAVDIGRGAFEVVFRDSHSEDGTGFTFGISCGADTIDLIAPGARAADAYELPEIADSPASACRISDGDEWTVCRPTPGAPNEVVVSQTPDDWFGEPIVRRIDLMVPSSSWRALEDDPRVDVPATIAIPGEDIGEMQVTIRLKGQRGSFRELDRKPAFKVDINAVVRGQRIFGLKEFTLNNMVQDRSLVHEYAAYELFRAIGVPAPRVTYVDLYIDGEPFGLYASVEGFDDISLAAWFDATNHLYEGAYGEDLYPDHVDGMDMDEGDPDDRSDLRDMADFVNRTGTEVLYSVSADRVDWPQVAAMMAAEFWIGHWDGYAPTRNNYFFHFDGDGVLSLLPWGTDQTFSQHRGVLDGRGLLFRACRDDAECLGMYLDALDSISLLAEDLDLADAIIEIEARLRPVAAADPRREYSIQAHDEAFLETLEFLAERPTTIARQTACLRSEDRDADGDGADCTVDCDPGDPLVFPGAPEICGDGIDQDCNGFADDDPACPDCVETPLLGRTYWICPTRRTYAEAVDHCADVGATPVRIESAEENAAIYAAAIAARDQDYWLGLTDIADEGAFVWFDGSAPTYTNWDGGEPNNAGGLEHCAMYWGGPEWNDIRCDATFGVICGPAE